MSDTQDLLTEIKTVVQHTHDRIYEVHGRARVAAARWLTVGTEYTVKEVTSNDIFLREVPGVAFHKALFTFLNK